MPPVTRYRARGALTYLAAGVIFLVTTATVARQAAADPPRLEVIPNTFAASSTCRATSANVARVCPRYASFTLTYTLATQFQPHSALKIAFGWPYNNHYLTSYLYTRVNAWPAPQAADPAAPNYVTVQVLEGGPSHLTPLIKTNSSTGELVVRFQGGLAMGASVVIHFGDVTGGSPGYELPALPYSIYMVVWEDPDGDSKFELCDAEMPRLSLVGTTTENFRVIAPSMPRELRFDVIVQALEGKDKPATNMFLVPGYAGRLKVSSSDPHAVLPVECIFDETSGGVAHMTVELPTRGIQTITVTDPATGITATSNPIMIRCDDDRGIAYPGQQEQWFFRAVNNGDDNAHSNDGKSDHDGDWEDHGGDRDRHQERDDDEGESQLQLFWGVLQQHTFIGGHGAGTADDAFTYGRDVAGLDFLALTEHCGRPDYRPEHSFAIAESYYEPGRFVTFAAYEWASREFGHRHVVFRYPWGGVNRCSRNSGNPTVILTTALDEFLAAFGDDALIIPHHSAWTYSPPAREGDDFVLGPVTSERQRLFEIFSHHGSSESYDNEPYAIHLNKKYQWGPDKMAYFQDAIAMGYRFGVVAGTDNHLAKPGGHVEGSSSYSRSGITGVYARDLTRKGIWEALNARRTYGTTGARILLNFGIGKAWMGEEVAAPSKPRLEISVTGTDVIERVDVFRDGYDLLQSFEPNAVHFDTRFRDLSVKHGQTYAYYVRVRQRDDHMAWSSPIWVRVTNDRAEARKHTPEKSDATHQIPTYSYPNPFHHTVSIRYEIDRPDENITLRIYDANGRHVRTIAAGAQPQGAHWIQWNGRDDNGNAVTSGVYFYQLTGGHAQTTKKLVLIR